jgi:demethylspheroidene O-methyltransferase
MSDADRQPHPSPERRNEPRDAPARGGVAASAALVRDRVLAWRDRLLADPRLQRWTEQLPLRRREPGAGGNGHGQPLRERILAQKDELLADPRFQRWAASFPLTKRVADRRAAAAFDLAAGFVYSQILLACVRLKLLHMLQAGPAAAADLAPRVDLPPERAERLLKAAAALDLAAAGDHGRWRLGELGAALLGNPGALAMVEHHDALYADLADPVALLRRGKGERSAALWPYAAGGEAAPGSADSEAYTRLMGASQPLVAGDVLDAYPFGAHRKVLDVGGADGSFLAALLARFPALEARLFDLPAVADAARAQNRRFEIIAGDFRRDPLPDGADLITLVRVAHDHDDDVVLALFRKAREALAPGGALLVAEPMSGLPGVRRMADAYFGFYLLAMGSGRARTPDELSRLLVAAGFNRIAEIRTRRPLLTGLVSASV